MKKSDYILFACSLVSTLIALLVVLLLLPSSISFSFSEEGEKSAFFLLLLTLMPLFSTYLVAISNKSRVIALSIIVLVDFYAMLVVLKALGVAINFSSIILLFLSLLFLLLALALLKGKIKAKPAWIKKDEGEEKARKLTMFLFFFISAELLIMALLSLLLGVNGGYVVFPIMLTAAIFLILIARKTI